MKLKFCINFSPLSWKFCSCNRMDETFSKLIETNIEQLWTWLFCYLKNWQQLYTYTSATFAGFWWQQSFNLTIQQQLLTYKCVHTKYISTGGLVCKWDCKLRSVILENIFIHQPLPRFSCGVVLDVGSCYFNVLVNSKLYHTPYAFRLLGYWVFKFPPPMD